MAICWIDLVTHAPSQNPTVSPTVYDENRIARAEKANVTLGEGRAMIDPVARRTLSQNPLPSAEDTYLRNRAAARGNCNLLDHTPQVDGFYSLVPRELNRIFLSLYERPQRTNPALLDFLGVMQYTTAGTLSGWTSRSTAMPLITAGQRPLFLESPVVFEQLWQTNTDFNQLVLLPPEAETVIGAPPKDRPRITTTEFGPQLIRFECQTSDPAVAVVANTFAPGWQGYVDGQRVALWRANYAFQALVVPAGVHQVTLRYSEPGLRFGSAFCAGGLGILAWIWKRNRRRPQAAAVGLSLR